MKYVREAHPSNARLFLNLCAHLNLNLDLNLA
jgi:hypothetical protein